MTNQSIWFIVLNDAAKIFKQILFIELFKLTLKNEII